MADTYRRSRSRTPRARSSRQNRHERGRSRDAKGYSDEYSDDYTDYSDSFVSDDDRPPQRKNKPATGPKYARKQATAPYQKKKTKQKPSFQKAADQVTKVMQETRRLKYNEMKNELDGLALKCRDLEEENKVLKRLQRRQEKALEKFENEESDLPQLMQRHNNELRSIKDQLRKVKEKNSRMERNLHEAEIERDQLRRQVNKYKDLAEEKGLPERDEMHRRLLAAEADVQEKDKRVKDLERHLENLTKNHKHQIGIEIARHKELQRKHDEQTEHFKRMQIQLKEKEKELEVKNIYANRMAKRQPASYGGTPHESPSPNKYERQRRLSNSEATPRQKAKAYELERRQKEKNKLGPDQKTDDKLAWEHLELDRHEAESLRQEKERRDRQNKEMKEREEQAIRERVEREELEIRLKIEREEREKRVTEARDREFLEERRLAEERERRRQSEERERTEREQEERERLERERKEMEWQEQKRKEEEKRERERLAQEQRAQEEKERMENDAKLQEERRKKDDLLSRLKALDSEPAKKEDKTPFFLTNEHNNSGTSSAASKKSSYSFSQATENLHNGKPSHEDNQVPYLEKQKNRQSISNDEDFGYQPSFSGSVFKEQKPPKNSFVVYPEKAEDSSHGDAARQKARKTNLMNELFGKSRENSNAAAPKKESSHLDDFISPKKNASPAQTKFPWDENSNGDRKSLRNQNKSSALFSAGTALVIDDDNDLTGNQGQLLPRRTRQQPTTIQTKPAVNAVDNFDDDIEEVIL